MSSDSLPPTRLGGLEIGNPEARKALVYSLWDGLLANGMIALTETFAIAAAVALKAPALAIALISSLPLLLGSIGQLALPSLLDPEKGRKRYVVFSAGLQSAFLAMVALVGYLPHPWNVWAFVVVFVAAGFSGNSTASLWIAWMGDLVPSSIRGRHFAWRSVFFGWMQLACALTAGAMTRHYNSATAPWELFTVVFLLAAIFRAASAWCLSRQLEPRRAIPHLKGTRFRPRKEFLTYVVAMALFQGGAAMSGPFFNLWFLRDLKFSYLHFAMTTSFTTLGAILSLKYWGMLADQWGTLNVLRLSGCLVSLVPLPYLFFSDVYIIWILGFLAGLAWGGFNIANFNYLLSATDREQRTQHIALAAAGTGISVFLFTSTAGLIAPHLPTWFTWKLQTLFLISFVLRALISTLFFHRFSDYDCKLPGNSVEAYSYIPGYRSGAGLMKNVFRAFRNQ